MFNQQEGKSISVPRNNIKHLQRVTDIKINKIFPEVGEVG